MRNLLRHRSSWRWLNRNGKKRKTPLWQTNIVILGSCTDQWDTAYIYFLDNSRLVGTGSYGSFKRVQINDNEVYFGNFIFFYLLHILFQSATAENTTEHFRMQGLHTSTQDRGIRGQVFHCFTGIPQWFYKLTSSACWQKLNSFFMQFGDDFVQTFLMINRY